MPLAYLADPWQKMKVREEIEVIFYTRCSNFQFLLLLELEAHIGKPNIPTLLGCRRRNDGRK